MFEACSNDTATLRPKPLPFAVASVYLLLALTSQSAFTLFGRRDILRLRCVENDKAIENAPGTTDYSCFVLHDKFLSKLGR